jgi:hypothetical protein
MPGEDALLRTPQVNQIEHVARHGAAQYCSRWTWTSESSSFDRHAIKCQRKSSVEHRDISFSVVEMSFPRSWKWTVGKGKTVSVGVCATRLDAIRQAQTFIDAVIDWAA